LLAIFGLLIVAFVLSIICYSFPVFYFKNIAESTKESLNQGIIGKQIKTKLGTILVFFLGTTFLIFPLVMIAFYLSILLIFLLVGIPILLFMMPTVYAVVTLALYECLTKNVGFFTAYGNAIKYVRYNFWSIIGNVFIFYIITTMITVIPSFIIQFLILGGGMLFDPSNPEALLLSAAFKWGIVLLYFVYILLGTFGQNLMFMNLGIVYYSEREKEENFFTKRKIDSIGSTNA